MHEAIEMLDQQVGEMTPPPLEAYYDGTKYWIPNSRGGYVKVSERDLRRNLRAAGVNNTARDDELVSAVDRFIMETQTERDIHYAGPLAGHDAGLHERSLARILVTSSPSVVESRQTPWPNIQAVLEGALDDPDYPEQIGTFHGWIQRGYQAIRERAATPSQALVLAGPAGSGKSLIQQLITVVIGGRVGKAMQYMTNDTTFNADLIGAEHLMLEDEQASKDFRARQRFGARIKEITVNVDHRLHAKGRDAIMVRPFWRLSVSLNDEPENLMVLPPIEESIEDKLILLKVIKAEMPMPTRSLRERDAFWAKLVQELPGYLHWLSQEFEIPSDRTCSRYGIQAWHHPDLLEAVDALSPEHQLLGLIDAQFRDGFEGSAGELMAQLTESDCQVSYQARKLLSSAQACGTYLGRLQRKDPLRFARQHTKSGNTWNIGSVDGEGMKASFNL